MKFIDTLRKKLIVPMLVSGALAIGSNYNCAPEENNTYNYYDNQKGTYQCNDLMDNDGDGFIDYEDLGCYLNGFYDPTLDNESINNGPTSYRMPVIIKNNEDETLLNNYTVELYVDTSDLISNNKMRNDCNDLTIMCENAEVNRKVTGCNAIDTLVEFATTRDISAGATDNTMCYLHYGEPEKAIPMNDDTKDNIYLWNDPLTSDLGGWFRNDHPGISWNFEADGLHATGSDGTQPFSAQFLRDLPADDDIEIRVDTTHAQPGSFSLDIKLRQDYTGGSTAGLTGIGYCYDTNNNNLYDYYNNFWINWGVGADRDNLRYNAITLIDDNLSFWYNTTSQGDIDTTQPPIRSIIASGGRGNYHFGFNRDSRNWGGAEEIIMKNLQIKRKYAEPPTISLGMEEEI